MGTYVMKIILGSLKGCFLGQESPEEKAHQGSHCGGTLRCPQYPPHQEWPPTTVALKRSTGKQRRLKLFGNGTNICSADLELWG